MSSEKWQLSSAAALHYHKFVHPLMVPWIIRLIDKAQIKSGQRVLDLACGTGFVSRLAAEKVGSRGQVSAVDLNEGMLAAARKYEYNQKGARIEWIAADVIELPFPDACFDLVLCQQGMQFFPDTQAAIKEIYRVLTPDGRLYFTVWHALEDNPYLQFLAQALGQHLSPQARDVIESVFAKSFEKDYEAVLHEFSFRQTEAESPILRFTLPALEDYVPGHLASLPIAAEIAALPESRQLSIVMDVKAALFDYVHGHELNLPSRSQVISAIK